MKHTNILNILLIAVMAMGITASCGSKATKSPGATAKKFTELFADGKTDKALEMVQGYKEASEEEQNKLKMFLAETQKELEEKDGIKSVEILEERTNEANTEADVTIKTIYGDGEEEETEQKLVKNEDGEWLIAMEK